MTQEDDDIRQLAQLLSKNKELLSKEDVAALAECIEAATENRAPAKEDDEAIIRKLNNVITQLQQVEIRAVWNQCLDVIQNHIQVACLEAPPEQQRQYYDQVLRQLIEQYGEASVKQLLLDEFRLYVRAMMQTGGQEHNQAESSPPRALVIDFKRALILDCPWNSWSEKDKQSILEAITSSND